MKNKKIKGTLKLLAIPITMLAGYLTLVLIWKIFSLPPPEEIVTISKTFMRNYGLPVLFIGALLEAILLVGQYFPGSIIIFLGVITAIPSIPKAILAVLITSIAFFTAHIINYILGKYGWHSLFLKFGLKTPIENAHKKYLKHGPKAILFGYWDPNLAAITSTSAGILKMNFKSFLFYSSLAILIWNIFWGTLVFSLGENALQLIFSPKYGIPIFLFWISVILITHYVEKRARKKS